MTAIMASCNQSRVYDEVRARWVAATPEECVRQMWLKKMLYDLGYPKELLCIERDLHSLPHVDQELHQSVKRRADLICFSRGIHPDHLLYPLLLMEFKKEEDLDQKALDQALGYNHYVSAYFVGIASASQVRLAYFDKKINNYVFYPFLPPYVELIQSLSHES